MTTLEKIRAELHATAEMHEDGDYYLRDKWVDEIINKYAEQEPSRDMEEIREVMDCDVDAETKCKMIFNILTAKPHYFAEQEPTTLQQIIKKHNMVNLAYDEMSDFERDVLKYAEQAEIQADYDRQKASGLTDEEWEYGKGGE